MCERNSAKCYNKLLRIYSPKLIGKNLPFPLYLFNIFMLAVWSNDQSVSNLVVIDMVSIQNLHVPFCCVLGKDTLQHFPFLASSSKFQLYLYK